MTDYDDNVPMYRPNWRDRRDMAARKETRAEDDLADALITYNAGHPHLTAKRILADPAPLLAALAEAGVLREDHAARLDSRAGVTQNVKTGEMAFHSRPATIVRRYVTEWRPADD